MERKENRNIKKFVLVGLLGLFTGLITIELFDFHLLDLVIGLF